MAVRGAVRAPRAFDDVAEHATNSTTGTLTTAIQSGKDAITILNDQVTAYDTRLAIRRQNLERQFTNLETALSKLKNQSSWLAGQIANLPTVSSMSGDS